MVRVCSAPRAQNLTRHWYRFIIIIIIMVLWYFVKQRESEKRNAVHLHNRNRVWGYLESSSYIFWSCLCVCIQIAGTHTLTQTIWWWWWKINKVKLLRLYLVSALSLCLPSFYLFEIFYSFSFPTSGRPNVLSLRHCVWIIKIP